MNIKVENNKLYVDEKPVLENEHVLFIFEILYIKLFDYVRLFLFQYLLSHLSGVQYLIIE